MPTFSHKHRAIYYRVPKTASASIMVYLIRRFGFQNYGGTHAHDDPPFPDDGYYRFLTVREPLDRFIAHWWFDCKAPERESRCRDLGSWGLSPEEYIHLYLDVPWNRMTQTEWVARTRAHWFRFEDLPENLGAVPFFEGVPELPHEHMLDSKPKNIYRFHTARIRTHISRHFADDYGTFGYAKGASG